MLGLAIVLILVGALLRGGKGFGKALIGLGLIGVIGWCITDLIIMFS